jgi:hypothetical protein
MATVTVRRSKARAVTKIQIKRTKKGIGIQIKRREIKRTKVMKKRRKKRRRKRRKKPTNLLL